MNQNDNDKGDCPLSNSQPAGEELVSGTNRIVFVFNILMIGMIRFPYLSRIK